MKFEFGWGSVSHPLGELTALPTSLAAFKGPLRGRQEGKEMAKDGPQSPLSYQSYVHDQQSMPNGE